MPLLLWWWPVFGEASGAAPAPVRLTVLSAGPRVTVTPLPFTP